MSEYQDLIQEIILNAVITGAEMAIPELPVQIMDSAQDLSVTLKAAKTLVIIGSDNMGVVGNSAIAGAGCFTGGSSLMGLKTTRNPATKAFYCLSVVSSSTAIKTAGFAVLARTCQISETAALSEACATPFMVLGNQANVRALQLEGKPIPPHLNRYVRKGLRRSVYNNNELSFVMPGGTNHIV